ncbi:DUF1707 SHOCT-like domain-containing protein [Aeromicrobium sp. P5_D10]
MAYSRTRARDADRAKAIEVLASAFADGQLSRAEHDSRVDKVQVARTFADLDAQLFDLQKPGETSWQAPGVPPKPGTGSPALLKGAAVATIAAVVLAVILPRVFSDDSAPAPIAGPTVAAGNENEEEQPEPIKDPRTAEGYAAFLKEMETKHRTTEMTSAHFSEDSVTVTLPVDPDKSRRYVVWSWDGEWSEYSTGKYSDSEQIWSLDLKKVDASKFAASMELALGKIEDAESVAFSIQPDGKSCYNIYVDNRFDESYYGRFACNGKVVQES